MVLRRGSRGGGGGWGARPPLIAPTSLKSPLNWQKKSWGRAPEPPAPPPFSNPGSPLVLSQALAVMIYDLA